MALPVFAVDSENRDILSIALSDAGLAENDVSNVSVHREYDDGRPVWDVRFTSSDVRYEYEIDALTGYIADLDIDRIRLRGDRGLISEEAARDAAAIKAGLDYSTIEWQSVRYDDGIYKVRLLSSGVFYEYAVNASTGDIIKETVRSDARIISQKEAESIALSRINESDIHYLKMELDLDDGRVYWEGEIFTDRAEYEFEIDAATGRIVDWDRDRF